MANIRLQILARKAREANQSVKSGRANSTRQPHNTQPPYSTRKPYHQQGSQGSKSLVGGIFDAIFNLFR